MNHQVNSKNIGRLNGRVLVFGGVYSNWQALEALRIVAETEGIAPHNVICTGDVVAYCAEPEICVQTIKNWGIHCIAGNVELQLGEGEADCGCEFNAGGRCDVLSRKWYPYAQSNLSEESIRWMHALPHHIFYEYAGLKGGVVHGSFFEVADYVFASTPWAKKVENFAAAKVDLILAGHSGLPFADAREGKYWLNAGVIGIPANDATPRVWYMLLDIDEAGNIQYEHRVLNYNYTLAATRMREQGLPGEYALTLETGLWDNCEILPEKETNLQGVKIELNSVEHI